MQQLRDFHNEFPVFDVLKRIRHIILFQQINDSKK